MLVLILGHRQPLARAIKRLNIPFIVWSPKPIKNKIAADQIIISEFPKEKDDVLNSIS